jgi:PAS domain S-box-containing protein
VVLLALAYALAAKVGLTFALAGANVSPLWPPTGVAIAVLVLRGPSLWPGVLAGAFLANEYVSPLPWPVALGISAGNTAEALVAAGLLRGGCAFDPRLERLRDGVALVVLGAGVSAALSATNGVAMLVWGKLVPLEAARNAWWTWWVGDAMGALVVAPTILVWAQRPWRSAVPGDRRDGWGILAVLLALGALVFLAPVESEADLSPLAYAALPAVVWAAYRFGPPGATLTTFLVSGLAILGTVAGRGAYSGFRELNERMALLQGFIAVASLSSLGFAALVSERKQAEEQRRKADEKLSLAMESAQVGVWDLDLARDRTPWTLGGEERPDEGALQSEWDTQTLLRQVHPEDRDLVQRGLEEALASGSLDIHYRIRWRDGSFRWIGMRGQVYRDAEGRPVRMMGLVSDITKRKEVETRLAESEQRYRAVAQTAHDAIVIADGEGRIVGWNPAAERMFGRTESEALGKPVGIIIPDRYLAAHEKGMVRYLATGEIHILGRTLEMEGIRSNGQVFPIEFTVSTWTSGQDRYFAALIRDITERRTMEDSLRRFAEELEARVDQRTREVVRAHKDLERRASELARSNKDLEQFAYVASHDLQEPLRMVASFTQLLAERYRGKLDPDGDEFIQFAVQGAQNMQQLIRDLLLYARVSSEGRPLEPTPLDEVLDKALATLEPLLQECRAKILREPLPVVPVDRVQGAQLLQNLLGNAIKFRDWRPLEIQIGARQKGEEWLFWVKDNGIGMEPKYLDRIFTLFHRLHSRGEYPGTGIGLSLCKRIVERHGGRIWAKSLPGEGSTFYFTLPVAEAGEP